MITPLDKPRWDEFTAKLEGPLGCNFREVVKAGKPDITWECSSTPEFEKATAVLRLMGLTERDVQRSLGFYFAFGGHCDCEILFNVESSLNSIYGRSRRAKNPPCSRNR